MRANKRLVTASRTTRDNRAAPLDGQPAFSRYDISKLFLTAKIRNQIIKPAYSRDGRHSPRRGRVLLTLRKESHKLRATVSSANITHSPSFFDG